MSDLLPLLWAAAAVPLLGAMVRAFARWAAGRSRWWLALGIACGACGVDGLVALAGRLRYLPLGAEARGGLWGLIGGALAWAVWREWRALGRRPSPAPPP